jgi:hypothetical protein
MKYSLVGVGHIFSNRYYDDIREYSKTIPQWGHEFCEEESLGL